MSPGSITESYPAFANIGLRENPGKKPQPGKFLLLLRDEILNKERKFSNGKDHEEGNKERREETQKEGKNERKIKHEKNWNMRDENQKKRERDKAILRRKVIYKMKETKYLFALYPSPDITRNIKSRRLRWTGHVARMGEYRNAYRVLVGRPEGKRPLGRPRRRWEDNMKMDLKEVRYDGRDWINLAQDRDQWRAYVRASMNLRVP
ncbi:hypothetical protein ANN_19989 [Periplaneta americana]|uniref:Uncharacterized protein n=1 Tax=Periplaneta americana TaxID=6978 RepID=A0ABQ8SCH6_PERAM|nr:hypothetical protein ANN_19989 [Periplaneta americana]